MYLLAVMLLNSLVNCLLLAAANQLSGFPNESGKLVRASLLGGIYAGICMLPGLYFLGWILWRLVFLSLIAWAAFGWNSNYWKRLAVFMLFSFALSGILALVENKSLCASIICSVFLMLLAAAGFGGNISRKKYIPIEITNCGNKIYLTALRDTGNTLRDPITGEDVLIIGGDAAQKLTGLTLLQLNHPIETLSQQQALGLRLIPYHTIGKSNGMLLAKRFSEVKFAGKNRSALVAFAPQAIGGEIYQALTGGNV